jgi:hypothetical protein
MPSMANRLVLVAALAGALLGPAQSAHAECVRSSDGPTLEAQVRTDGSVRTEGMNPDGSYRQTVEVKTTTLWVCNRRRGRATVLARGRLEIRRQASGIVYARGRRVGAMSVAGRFVAWTEVSADGAALDRSAVVLRLATFPSGTVVRQRVVLRGRGSLESGVGLVLNRWRDLVWAMPDGSTVLWRAGRQPSPLRAAEDAGPLRLYDGGRTLVWGEGEHFVDLRRPRQRNGCPMRKSFEAVESTSHALVTRARLVLGDDPGDLIVWRTCWRAEHRDHVVFVGYDGWDPSLRDRLVRYAEPWLLLGTEAGGRYSYLAGKLTLIDVRSGTTTVMGGDWELPLGAVVLADSSVAWVGNVPAPVPAFVLHLARPGMAAQELDTGSSLTALSAQGSTLTWLHDGQPRSYVVGSR